MLRTSCAQAAPLRAQAAPLCAQAAPLRAEAAHKLRLCAISKISDRSRKLKVRSKKFQVAPKFSKKILKSHDFVENTEQTRTSEMLRRVRGPGARGRPNYTLIMKIFETNRTHRFHTYELRFFAYLLV